MDTNLITRFYSDNAQANRIWRFFSDSDHQWRWERLAFNGTVLEQSKSGYPQYESCMADASESGYVFLASSSTKPKSTAPKKKRSYMRMPTQTRQQAFKRATEVQEQKVDIPIADAGLDASGVLIVSE